MNPCKPDLNNTCYLDNSLEKPTIYLNVIIDDKNITHFKLIYKLYLPLVFIFDRICSVYWTTLSLSITNNNTYTSINFISYFIVVYYTKMYY